MSMRTNIMILLTAAGLALSGCATYSAPPPLTAASLAKQWRLTSINNRAVTPTIMTLTLTADGQASGNIACNSFSGPYTLVGESLTFNNVAVTVAGCIGSDQIAMNEAEKLFATPNKVKLHQGVMDIESPTMKWRFR